MNRAITLALIATLFGCSSTPAKPDATATLIAQRYSDCVPRLEAKDIRKISDRRYSWNDPKGDWALAWSVAPAKDGDPLTVPTDDSLSQFEKLGCM